MLDWPSIKSRWLNIGPFFVMDRDFVSVPKRKAVLKRARMVAVKNFLSGNKETNREFSLANQKTVFASFCLLVQPAHNYHYFVVTCISILILLCLWFSAFYIVGFAICLFLLYNLMPIAMQFSSATVVNLSLLTADFYSLLCGIFLFHYKVSFLHVNSVS